MTEKRLNEAKAKACSRPGCGKRYYAKTLCYAHYRREYYWRQKKQKNPRPNRPWRREGVKGEVWLPGARVPSSVKQALEIEARAAQMDLTPFIQRVLIAISKDSALVHKLVSRAVATQPPPSYK